MQCDPSLLEGFEGLKPDEDKYQTYLDIDPELGITMEFKVTGQISLAMSEVNGMEQAKGLRDMIFPLMYFVDESNDYITTEDIERIKSIIAKRT